MKKVFLASAIMFAGFMGANAQPTEGFTFGGSIRLGLPIGDFADFHSFGIGGLGGYKQDLRKKIIQQNMKFFLNTNIL